MLKCYATHTPAIVPFYAKSAASIVALGTDELVMCKAAELGSIDPQVKDIKSKMFVPAHSIKEAINFIEETKDLHVKLQLTDQIPPLLIEAYRETEKSTKQYLDEILTKLGDSKESAISAFTERFLSHGYPIDRDLLKSIGINVCEPDSETEDTICELHEMYTDLSLYLYSNLEADERATLILLQMVDEQCVVFGGEDITNQLITLKQPTKDTRTSITSETLEATTSAELKNQ